MKITIYKTEILKSWNQKFLLKIDYYTSMYVQKYGYWGSPLSHVIVLN